MQHIENSGYSLDMFAFYMAKLGSMSSGFQGRSVSLSSLDFPTMRVNDLTLLSVRDLIVADMSTKNI